jgi:twinkle protein
MRLISDNLDLSEYLKEPDPGERVVSAATLEERVIEAFCTPPSQSGALLPWTKTHDVIQLRPGEVSLWPGINGHGKSAVTSQVALDLCFQGYRVCIASLEMKTVKTMQRMCRQAWGGAHPQIPYLRSLHQWTDERLWFFDYNGTILPDKILAVVRYCQDRLGVQHFFIDSLMKCVKGEDDYNGQKDFVNAICAIAQDTGIHIHLIHHAKKLANEYELPNKFSAKGSGAITDQVDNVFTVYRNKKKEHDMQAGENVDPDLYDAMVICDKQRHGEWEGKIRLWYDQGSYAYRGDRMAPIRRYEVGLREAA